MSSTSSTVSPVSYTHLKDKTVFVRYPAGKLLKEFNIPDGVKDVYKRQL